MSVSASTQFDETVSPLWTDLSVKSVVDYSVITEREHSHSNDSGDGNIHNKTNLTFRLAQSSDYLLLNRAYFHVIARIVRDDGQPIVGDWVWANPEPLTMFKTCELVFLGTVLEQHTYPGISSFAKKLVRYPKDWWDTHGKVCGNERDVSSVAADNTGELERKAKWSNGKWVEMKIPVASIFKIAEELDIPWNLGMEIRLTFDKFKSFLQGGVETPADPPDPEVYRACSLEISNFKLCIPGVSPSNQAAALVSSMVLAKQVVNKVFVSQRLLSTALQAGNTSHVWDITYTKLPPAHITLVAVPQSHLTGTDRQIQQGTPTRFSNLDLKQLTLSIDSERIPHENYNVNFDPNAGPLDYLRLYNCLIDGHDSAVVTYEQFRDVASVFHFNLESVVDGSKYDRSSTHAIRVELRTGALPVNMMLFCILDSERVLSVSPGTSGIFLEAESAQ